MNKLAMMIAAVAVLIGNASPVFAADNQSDADKFIVSVSTIPARLIGMTAGIGLGVPLAAVQSTVDQTGNYSKKISDALPDSDSPANKAYSTIIALPVGIASGLINGTFYGVKHGTQGFDHPFSAESFSINMCKNVDEY